MSQTVRTGVIGVGHMGWNHARTYSQLPNVELVGVADRNQQRAHQAADEFGTRSIPTGELLDTVDAVSIAVPTQHHDDLVADALDAGTHVLVEKPFVSNVERGRTLVERAEETGLTLQVGHIEQYNPAIATMADIVSNFEVVAISARRVGPAIDRNLLEGVALDLMIHDIDIVLSLVDQPLEAVTSVSTASGQHASATMQFEGGVVADLTASRRSQREVRTVEVITDSGCVVADCLDQSVEIHRPPPQIDADVNGRRLYQCDGVIERPRIQRVDQLRVELESFVDSVRNGTEPRTDGRAGLRAVEIAQQIEAAPPIDPVTNWITQ